VRKGAVSDGGSLGLPGGYLPKCNGMVKGFAFCGSILSIETLNGQNINIWILGKDVFDVRLAYVVNLGYN